MMEVPAFCQRILNPIKNLPSNKIYDMQLISLEWSLCWVYMQYRALYSYIL